MTDRNDIDPVTPSGTDQSPPRTGRETLPKAPEAEVDAFRRAHPDVTQIDVLIPDASGVLRGKKVPVESLKKIYREGAMFPGSLFATDITGSTVEETGLGFKDGDSDRPCFPVPQTLDPIPWLKRPTGQIMLSMRNPDGTPFFADPRAVLAGVVQRLNDDGYFPVVAIELEFYLIDRAPTADGLPQPPLSPVSGRRQGETQVYGIEELYDFDAMLSDVYDACQAQNIPVDSSVSEYAPGQYEINLHHVANAMDACDDAILFKRAVKSVAMQHGIDATFMSKPYADQSGSGFHIHLSMLDRDGRNIFAAEDVHGTPELRHAIGGLGETMADGMAFFAQNQNAFRRFQTNSYAPHAPTWAHNNRSASLRIPPSPAESRRVEHRVAGADANPYLVMAAVLAGAHYGLTHTIDPGKPVTGNAYESVDQTLTSSWIQALERLEKCDIFRDYLGTQFVEVYLALKRAEREKFFSMITALEYEWYLHRV
ncbi:glutamine synthetase family protein [Fodinicurvata sp. EGI_FJ10296]|uniref:glutamine synthetase family protein n=1 Tax=Fodinicurvata sp. EGI_FJ10296 TaxID=3231908 RepID=UPI003454C48C